MAILSRVGYFSIRNVHFLQRNYYFDLYQILQEKTPSPSFENHSDFKDQSKRNYDLFLEKAYDVIRTGHLSDIEIATMFNVNREVHGANKSLVNAIKEYSHVQSRVEEESINQV